MLDVSNLKLTVVRLKGPHEIHLHVADKCELGVYSCFSVPVLVSHNLRVPSALDSAKYSPFGEKAMGQVSAILLNTCCLVRMRRIIERPLPVVPKLGQSQDESLALAVDPGHFMYERRRGHHWSEWNHDCWGGASADTVSDGDKSERSVGLAKFWRKFLHSFKPSVLYSLTGVLWPSETDRYQPFQ